MLKIQNAVHCPATRHPDDIMPHAHRNYLSQVVKREPGEEDVSKELSHTEHPIGHPVGQPFCVIFFGGTLDGFDPETHLTQTQILSQRTLN